MKWARRVAKIADPTAREVLRYGRMEGVISLAGGIPAKEALAEKKISKILREQEGEWEVQYGQAGGDKELREEIARWLSEKWEQEVAPEEVLITVGSQQGLDLLGRALVDEEGWWGLERPSYFVALYAFGAYGAEYREMRWERLPEELEGCQGVYVVSSFQNPTGKVLSEEVREKMVRWAREKQVLLIEDGAYDELYFDKVPPKPLAAREREWVVYVGSFSKVLAPGLRVGYVVARREVIEMLEKLRTGEDICPPTITQAVVREVLRERGWWKAHLEELRRFYRQKAEWLEESLQAYLAGEAEWEKPEGGMFYWVRVPGRDSYALLEQAVAAGVAYVPGQVFDFKREPSEYLRLSFATASREEMEEGIRRLKRVLTKD